MGNAEAGGLPPATDAACRLSVVGAAAAIREGTLRASDLVEVLLARVAAVDDRVRAWAFLDAGTARRQAEAADEHRARGRPLGPLHGVPVALKDIFETWDMPTGCGSPVHAGRRTGRDAVCVDRLRRAGAVILGKTVTTEFCYSTAGETTNPHDPRRTPGGSSSGSAAAVAAGMVPGALGSQTNGSVIRPASFCGVIGYKPSYGLIPRTGVQPMSRALDHVGLIARTVEDVALLADAMAGPDPGDPDGAAIADGALLRSACAPLPRPPRLAFVRTPAWDQAEPATHAGFARLTARLGGDVQECDLGRLLDPVYDRHATLMAVEMAHVLADPYDRSGAALSPALRAQIERGRAHRALDYRLALDGIESAGRAIDEVFRDYDAILTPSAAGEAPVGLGSTGNAIFCTPWSYLRLPAISLPVMTGPSGLPVGAQLVGRRGDDARLLRVARWLMATAGA
ncbi:MAG: amidase [Alphaproteobacteria bacterium]